MTCPVRGRYPLSGSQLQSAVAAWAKPVIDADSNPKLQIFMRHRLATAHEELSPNSHVTDFSLLV
jgi:hypothetical protein